MLVVKRDVTSLVIPITVVDDSNVPQTGITPATATFSFGWLDVSTGTWTSFTLQSMTPGNWVSAGWYEVGNGVYLFGVPNTLVEPDNNLPLRYLVTGNNYRYDTVSYTSGTTADVDYTDLTNAFSQVFAGADSLSAFPVSSDSQVIKGDDHDASNDRGAIGPYRISSEVDLLNDRSGDDVVVIRSGFSLKLSANLYGTADTQVFQGSAYAVAVSGEDYSDPDVAHPYDIYIEVAGSATEDVAQGTYGCDVEAVQDVGGGDYDIVTIMRTEIQVVESFGGYSGTYTP